MPTSAAGGKVRSAGSMITRHAANGMPWLAAIRAEEGDVRDDFEVHVVSADARTPDGVRRLEEKGVTDCVVGFRAPYAVGPDTEPLATKIEQLEAYAERVIAKVDPRDR